MWKLNESILGGDGEGREGFLDDESEGLCSLSPMQVYIYINHTISILSTWVLLIFRFSKTIIVLGFDYAENLCFCRVFGRWSGLYDPGMSIFHFYFFKYIYKLLNKCVYMQCSV